MVRIGCRGGYLRNGCGRDVGGVAVDRKEYGADRIYGQLCFRVLYSADKPCGGVPHIRVRKFEADTVDLDNGLRRRSYTACNFKHGYQRLLHRLHGGISCADLSGEGNTFGNFVAFAAGGNFNSDSGIVYGFLY